MQLKLPTLSDILGTEMDEASAAAKLQSSMFLESIEGCPVPSHTKMLYPWCESKPERVFSLSSAKMTLASHAQLGDAALKAA